VSDFVPHGGVPARAVTLRTDSRLENVELVARAVRGLCAASGVEGRECARVELALAEAMNNVIRHAYHGQPGHPIEILFTLEARRFTLEVADEGTPMPPRPAPMLDFDPGDLARLPEGGMGLYIIHSVMDQVEYHARPGRNALVMSRRLAA
jgi:serine/threonine-protein kinase RsbW